MPPAHALLRSPYYTLKGRWPAKDRPALTEERRKLAENAVGMATAVVRKYFPTAVDQEELVGVACLAICHAAAGYDATIGEFSTYATWYARGYIYTHFSRERRKARYHKTLPPSQCVFQGWDGEHEPGEFFFAVEGDEPALERTDVERLLRCLPPREKRMVVSYFGLFGQPELNLREIGEAESVTKERVRQIVARAVGKIRDMNAVNLVDLAGKVG